MDRLDDRLVDEIGTAAAAVQSPRFTPIFDRIVTFGGRRGNRAIVLGTNGENEPVRALAADLHARLSATGFRLPRAGKLTPYVTLAYGSGFEGVRYLAQPILWEIDEIVLIDGLMGKGTHRPLGNWPLGR